MIIEALTAFSTVKVVWESLEILHYVRVGHETGRDAHRAGNFLVGAVRQRLQKREYEKDPALQFVREANTSYDLQATGDAEKAIKDFNKEAKDYLTLLNTSLGILNDAKSYFLETHRSLEKLVNALRFKDEQRFSSNLSGFKNNFKSFKDKFKLFSLSIEPPDRKGLYIADISKGKGKGAIEKFNAYLESIDECFNELKETKEKIADLFKNDFHVISTSLSETSSSSALSFEQLKQRIRGCMDKPELIPETMGKILSKNTELADLCTDIAQTSTVFKKIDSTDNEQANLWNDDPNWLPLLTEEKQIETGQRIFLHAMNDTDYSGKAKSQIAEIFLRQHVSEHEINQVIINLLSQELANSLIVEQIKKCEKLIQFLSELTQVGSSREHDPYGLLEWLEITRRTENSVECLIKLLVLPYCLSQYHIESLQPKLKTLLPYENIDALIKKYRASHWGAIREKSDKLIQLPASFKTNIIPNDRFQKDEQSEESNVVSSVMSKLSEALIIDIETLKAGLYEKKEGLDANIVHLRGKEKDTRDERENLEHENGVGRIKESHRYIASINHPTNNLSSYLYNPKTLNEVEKERQVPTIDDLLQVIYRGVDLHGVCKCKGNPDSNSNLLLDYFYPEQQNDSRMEAFVYALNKCQINARPLLHLFSYPAEPLLAIGNGDEKNPSLNPSLIIILKNSKKISVPVNSMALNNISLKAKEETEIFINQLDDYYNLSFMRLKPELRKELPLVEKFKVLVQGLFNFGQKIREERFESVQIIMGKLNAVVSAEDIMSINKAIDDFKENYENRYKLAKSTYSSTLYTLTKKAMNGCISEMHCLSEAEQKQLELEVEKAKVESLQASLDVMKQEKEVLKDQLEKSEAQRERDKEAMVAQRERDKEVMEAKLKESEARLERDKEVMEAKLKESEARLERDQGVMEAKLKEFEAKLNKLFTPSTQQQLAPTPTSASDAEVPGSSNNAHFFRH